MRTHDSRLGSVGDGVGDQIGEDFLEQALVAHDLAIGRNRCLDAHALLLCHNFEVVDLLADERREIEGLLLDGVERVLEAGEVEQLADESADAVERLSDGRDFFYLFRALTEHLELAADDGERGLEIVRDVDHGLSLVFLHAPDLVCAFFDERFEMGAIFAHFGVEVGLADGHCRVHGEGRDELHVLSGIGVA
jgi:hypothetical protein